MVGNNNIQQQSNVTGWTVLSTMGLNGLLYCILSTTLKVLLYPVWSLNTVKTLGKRLFFMSLKLINNPVFDFT